MFLPFWNRCEREVRRLLDLRDFSFAQPNQQEAILNRSKHAYQRSGVFLLMLGVSLVAWGYFDPTTTFIPVMGLVLLLYGVWTLLKSRPILRTDQFRLCPKCGYNITGNTSGQCPECGYQV